MNNKKLNQMKTKINPQIAKYPHASSRKVKLGDIIIHEVSEQEQTLNEFGLNFWKNCHPIERKGWRIKPKQ